jgi:hypothetical protein
MRGPLVDFWPSSQSSQGEAAYSFLRHDWFLFLGPPEVSDGVSFADKIYLVYEEKCDRQIECYDWCNDDFFGAHECKMLFEGCTRDRVDTSYDSRNICQCQGEKSSCYLLVASTQVFVAFVGKVLFVGPAHFPCRTLGHGAESAGTGPNGGG